MIYLIPFLIGLFNSISELSNQGFLNNWPQWFTQDSWNNKHTWKPVGLWEYWPFIVITDAFHFFKTCWVIVMCYGLLLGSLNPFYAFAVYSASFQLFYWVIPYLKVKR